MEEFPYYRILGSVLVEGFSGLHRVIPLPATRARMASSPCDVEKFPCHSSEPDLDHSSDHDIDVAADNLSDAIIKTDEVQATTHISKSILRVHYYDPMLLGSRSRGA